MALTKKDERTLNRALDGFFSVKSFDTSPPRDQLRKADFLSRSLTLPGEHLRVLSDTGLAHLWKLINVLNDADLMEGAAEPEDVALTVRRVLADLLSKGLRPDDGKELAEIIRERIGPEVQNRTFAVPMYGVELNGVDELNLDYARIVRSPRPAIEASQVRNEHVDVPGIVDKRKGYLWLLAMVRGTRARGEKVFREQAQLATGILALLAAARYEWGALRFRIGVVTDPVEDSGTATWFSWSDGSNDLTVHHSFGKESTLKLNAEEVGQFERSEAFQHMLKVASSGGRTEIERALVKALYWFSDAHRDPVPVMQFVKYWSCVETFFSGDGSEITKSLSSGLAAVLVHGGYGFVPEQEYVLFGNRVAKLYGRRSRALHGGVYSGLTDRDVADLSQWAAWLLICMASFAANGYESLADLRCHIDRIDGRY